MKIKTKNVNAIDVSDWDSLVRETYGKPYSFQQQDGCRSRGVFYLTVPSGFYDYENDTVPEIVNHKEMGVSFSAWLARDPKLKISVISCFGNDFTNLWWERNFYPDIQMIANDLHAKGLLDSGSYIIDINW